MDGICFSESYKHKLKELTETEKTLQEEIAMYKQDIENLKKTYEEKEKNLLEEHVYNQENLQVCTLYTQILLN